MDEMISFLMGWLSTITGVALGGWLVFRTKREGYDSLFAPPVKGESFNVADAFASDFSTESSSTSKNIIPEATMRANDLFVNQFAESLASRGDHNVKIKK